MRSLLSLKSWRVWIEVAICTAIALLIAVTLANEYRRSLGSGPVLGEVLRAGSGSERRADGDYGWTPLKSGDRIFAHDQVQTGPNGATSLRLLENDWQVELQDDTALAIEPGVNRPDLRLLRGSILVRRPEGDNRVRLGSDGKPRLEELPVRLTAPEPLVHLYGAAGKARTIRFEWRDERPSMDPTSRALTLEIATDRAFQSAGARSFPAGSKAKGDLSATLPPGHYFWKISERGTTLTETRELWIEDTTPLEAISPKGGARVFTGENRGLVTFQWGTRDELPASLLVRHRLDVARDSAFRELLAQVNLSTQAGSIALQNIPPGRWYWRLATRYGDGEGTSEPETFVVIPGKRLSLRLERPADGDRLDAPASVAFHWSADESVGAFRFELVELTPQGQKTIQDTRTSQKSFTWKDPATGNYRWRVTPLVGNHAEVESDWRALRVRRPGAIALLSPSEGQQIAGAPGLVQLSWGGVDPAIFDDTAYEVQVSPDPKFQHVVSRRTRESHLSGSDLELAPGAYHWRVFLLNADGHRLAHSPIGSFVYSVTSPARAIATPAASPVTKAPQRPRH